MTFLFLFFIVIEEDLFGGNDDVLLLPSMPFDVLLVGYGQPTLQANVGLV